MKLLGSTKKEIDKDKNGENVSKLESVEVVLVHCNLVTNDYFIFINLQIKLVKHLKLKIMLILH